jgi:hypothetical protein
MADECLICGDECDGDVCDECERAARENGWADGAALLAGCDPDGPEPIEWDVDGGL